MKTVIGLFESQQQAEQSINNLHDLGFAREDIGVVARDTVVKEREVGQEERPVAGGVGSGAVGGTAVGGLGGLLVGLGAIIIPGIGPAVAAGTLLTTLGTTAAGAGIGAATGGLIGALVGSGVPEEDAQIYSEGVQQGGILVTVQAGDERADAASDVMQRAEAVDIKKQREG
jgi:uncharacterized membrane protein